jgi:hypothetical protein
LDGFWQFGLKICYDGFRWFDLKISGNGFLQFGLKTGATVFSDLASKPTWWRVFRLVPQNRQLCFGYLDLKITVTVSWFGHQN